jgi:hypothetical protein
MRFRTRLITLAGFAAAGLALVRAWRREPKLTDVTQTPTTPALAATTPKQSGPATPREHQHPTSIQRAVSVVSTATFLALIGLAVWVTHAKLPILADISLIIAVALWALLRRGPKTHYQRADRLIAVGLGCIQLAIILVVTITRTLSTTDPIILLGLAACAICGVSVVVYVALASVSKSPFTEPLAVGVIAIALSAMCVPALRTFTSPLDFPISNSAALLFVNGPVDNHVSLAVDTYPESDPMLQGFIISNLTGSRPINWALLLIGSARFRMLGLVGTDLRYRNLTLSGFPTATDHSLTGHTSSINAQPVEAELFSGGLQSHDFASIGGWCFGRFINTTYDRSAVALPYYGAGDLADLDERTTAIVTDVLGGKPRVGRANRFQVKVFDRDLLPFESISQATPTPTSGASGNPEWTSNDNLTITYATVNQAALDRTNNALFVFAILLGVAGAGLVTSLQGAIHAMLSRRSST